MQFLSIVSAALLLLVQDTTALPAPQDDALVAQSGSTCRDPLVRKEWRTLAKKDQLAYISAVKCLMSKPGRTSSTYSGVKTRYDDYQALHIAMTEQIHFVGQFLPYHRRLLAIYEADLRGLCGYKGAQPYWDWTKDSASEKAFANSPVFDATYGFGGNGPYLADISGLPVTSLAPGPYKQRTGGGCVADGPFANHTVAMGPGNSLTSTPHCLRRDLIPSLATHALTPAMAKFVASAPNYWRFNSWTEIANLSSDLSGITTHGGGHFGVGGMVGEMSDMYSSPGDPLFYLHHAKLDYEWNKWQRASWPARKYDIGGPDTMFGYPYSLAFGMDPPYKNITLDFKLQYPLMASTVAIRDVMDTQAGVLCYTYA